MSSDCARHTYTEKASFLIQNADLKQDAALLQEAEINRLASVNKENLDVLRDWLGRPEGGNSFFAEAGHEGEPWLNKKVNDLVALCPKVEDNALTRWFGDKFIPWLHRICLHHYQVRVHSHHPPLSIVPVVNAIRRHWGITKVLDSLFTLTEFSGFSKRLLESWFRLYILLWLFCLSTSFTVCSIG